MGEVLAAWLLVTGVLLIILLANQVASVLQRAAVSQYPQGVVLQLIGLGALQNLSILLPIGLLLGVVLAFGRLYHDSEMAAVLACGASPLNVYLPVGLLAVFVTACLAWLTLVLAPNAMMRTLSLRSAALRAAEMAPLAPGKFRVFGDGTAVVYAEKANPDGTLANVFVESSRGPLVEVAVARRARHTVTRDGLTHIITLYDGERFEGVPGSPEFRMGSFLEESETMQVPPLKDAVHDRAADPTAELLGSHDPRMLAELQWRIATPVMCLVLAVLAIPLARLKPRQGRYDRVWIAVVLYFVYFNLATTGKSWLARGVMPATLGLWWVHILVVLLVLLLLLGPELVARLRHRVRGA